MPESETNGKARQFSKFPSLKIIIDCTEIFTQKPSCLQANKKIYSNYKGHTTFKFLVGIDPHGAIVYVSQAWGGRTSDNHITANSPGLTTKLNRGDELMADRGFAVQDLFADMGVKVTITDFKGQRRSQLNKMEEDETVISLAKKCICLGRGLVSNQELYGYFLERHITTTTNLFSPKIQRENACPLQLAYMLLKAGIRQCEAKDLIEVNKLATRNVGKMIILKLM